MSSFSSITEILKNFSKIGVNLSESNRDLLKWRLSEEGQKYYTIEENNNFYKAVEKGDTSVIDVARKEKQKRINNLKQILPLFVLLLLGLLPACISAPDPNPHITSDSLKENEKIYSIIDQQIKTEDNQYHKFDGQWYIVNKDLIKQHNENQDDLINALELIKDNKKQMGWMKYVFAGSIAMNIIIIILIIVRKKL